ncbi:uncharacterized protein [Amphiura filiformis]|uniref:uncharacterized protein n=1 Tax=Amphiura filiformis TaxID=82378 RepID=UPI003B227B6A
MNYYDDKFRRDVTKAIQTRNVDRLSEIIRGVQPDYVVLTSNPYLDILVDILSENIDACNALISASNEWVNATTLRGETLLFSASATGHVDVSKLLITEGNADVNKARFGYTPMYAASMNGHVDVCRILISDGKADVNKAQLHGETPLYAASKIGHLDVCRILVTEGKADVNKAQMHAETPLYAASENGHLDVCRILVTEGKADVNKAQTGGRTPLHKAVENQRIDICKMLVEESNADPSQVDNAGKVPLDYWPTNRDIPERRDFVKSIKASQISALLKKSGSTPVETIKLFFVGHPAKGKSTLKTSLTTGLFRSLFTIRHHDNRIPTPGIKVKEKTIGGAGSFMIWDTAGQVEFHITHAMLLGTGRGVFFVVYSCCDPEDEQTEQLKYWLCFIKACHDPTEVTKPVIQLIGTHVDQSKDVEMASALSTRHVEYLQLIFQEHVYLNEHVILLDSRQTRSKSLGNLRDTLNELAEPFRGELTPKLCDEIMKRISSWCNSELPLMYFKEFVDHVRQGIDRLVKDETLNLALGYLHDMGQIHHTRLAGRDAIIIVHPNWLTTTIFAPIFAPPNFRADYSGLPLKQEYTVDDLKHYFKLKDHNLLVDLLEYFELAYR